MGKYSHFKRRAHDAYDTPESGILPLLSHIPKGARFAEPCAGHGDMVLCLQNAGYRLTAACDIEPRGRISWMGNGTGGKEDAAWFRFVDHEVNTQFIGRAA